MSPMKSPTILLKSTPEHPLFDAVRNTRASQAIGLGLDALKIWPHFTEPSLFQLVATLL